MLFELTETFKAAPLFAGMEDTLILSCLQGVMGKIFVLDPEAPRSAMAYLSGYAFFAGEPEEELVMAKPEAPVCMIPQNEAWARLIERLYPNAEKQLRYAIRKDTRFDFERLCALASSLPEGYEFRRFDSELYDMCLGDVLFGDCVEHFESKEQYLALGRGMAAMKDGVIAAAASSYSVYRGGVEVQICTHPDHRRRGLAAAVGAAFILDCLKDGLYPSWDAANADSLRLALRLGYEFNCEYAGYEVE